ncbi:hypothetical protein CD934_13880 [Streptomyces calvus]|uniref:YrdC-like domain-containing protein n=1 Tax=Streptomyces calvus TaxID=67282 RepID=A0A514JQU8_9ACTN|nr:hypothetical protein [Streptomyces calvus]QDI69675.1 hypothetical protein CD934_13880 [Streptomyces calvus]
MTGVPAAEHVDRAPVSLAQAGRALRDGEAVVLPNPAPLTHVVTACRARTVNEAKGRPGDQSVALWAHHPDMLRALDQVWALGPDQRTTVRWLLLQERSTVLVPVRDGIDLPDWAAPAVKDGWMLLFGARWQPLRPLLDDLPLLYVSSANRTGHRPAATTADALAMFPATVAVLAVPEAEDPSPATDATKRQATTTIRLHPDGRPELHRHGAQDRHHSDPDEYLRHLRDRCAQAARQHGAGGAPPAASPVPAAHTAGLLGGASD